ASPGNSFTFSNILAAANNPLANTASLILNVATTIDAAVSGAGGLTLLADATGNGTGTLTLSQASTFTGAVTVAAGTLDVTGQGTLAATNYNIDVGGTLLLDNSGNQAGFNPVRLPVASAVTFNGGTLQFLGSNTAGAAS